jgi:hypothetical protein
MILVCRENIVKLKLDRGKVLGVLGYRGVHVFPEPHPDADPYHTGFSLRGKTRCIFEPDCMIDERLGIIEQGTPAVCEVHASLIANEQPQAQLGLQLLNVATQRRLADIQALRSPRKIQFASQFDEVAQLPQFHL